MEKVKQIFSKILSVLSTLILIFSIIAVLFTFFYKAEDNNKLIFIGKYAIVRILTKSMEPEISAGNYIVIERVELDELNEGDIITFLSPDPSIKGYLNTHRVISIDGQSITTKGDNNVIVDKYPVEFANVEGRFVMKIGFVEGLINIFSSPIGFVSLVVLPMMFIIYGYMKDFTTSLKENKEVENEQEQPTLSDEERIKLAIEEMKKSGELAERLAEMKETENTQKDDEPKQ